MKPLLAFGRLPNDPQSIPAAVFGFADVRSERLAYLSGRAMKCRAATLTNDQHRIASHNAHFSGTHEYQSSAKGLCK